MINELREEFYFGEDSPLICDENGNYTKPDVFRRRFHRLLDGAGIESKGLHALRHTFATNLVNGVRQPDGTIKALTVRQVADLSVPLFRKRIQRIQKRASATRDVGGQGFGNEAFCVLRAECRIGLKPRNRGCVTYRRPRVGRINLPLLAND